jgi:dihydropteroate synthase
MPAAAPAGLAPVAAAAHWRTARALLTLDRPRILGILNVTPDSFWDGGKHTSLEPALRQAAGMVEAGVDIVDVGGESTRPGARAVSVTEELERVIPVVRALARHWPDLLISVDTVKAEVAAAALAEGAAIINDVSATRLDPQVAHVAALAGAGLLLMHSRGGVERMAGYDLADYGPDPVGEIASELNQAALRARQLGVAADAIALDPGLGFSKRTEHSVAALRELARLVALGYPVAVGPSRKRFIGELGGGLAAENRLEGTLAACVVALLHGARLFRVHDVLAARRALEVADALDGAP